MSHSLNQFAWVAGTDDYKFGHRSIPNMPISGAPADTNFDRWAMLFDGTDYRLYFFKGSTRDTLYQFAFNSASGSYEFGFRSISELKLTGLPEDASSDSFAMLHDGATYRLYLRKLGDKSTLYQFGFNPATSNYEFGYNSIPEISVTNAPTDTDWSRWAMLHDGSAYRLYAFRLGTNAEFYQAAFNPRAGEYQFGFNSIADLDLSDIPKDSDLSDMGMLHDGSDYRFYLKKI